MRETELIWRIAGGSGDGVDSTSHNFAMGLMRSGLHVFTHRHYPSRIRGGHTFVEIRADDEPVKSRGDGYNFLLALGDSFARNPQEEAYYGNEQVKPLTENLDDLREDGIIVYDSGLIDIEEVSDFDERVAEHDWNVYPVDLRSIAKEHGREVMRNTAGVGITAALLDLDLDIIETLMEEAMGGSILEQNLAVIRDAHQRVGEELDMTHEWRPPTGDHADEQAFISGSQGIAYGAIDAGCRFTAGYPMTPWSEVFHILSNELPPMGGIAEQVEDEIAAASLAIGASHTGVKALSGSSGGGFALMSEPLGLAEMTETPLVLVEAMRCGPSTGMPTKPEQGDLEHVLYTSQGDSNRVVFAPGTPQESYEQTRTAFDIAHEYQLPAIVITDQMLTGMNVNIDREFFDREPDPALGSTLTEEEIAEAERMAGKFTRYGEAGEDGISPRSLPGQRGGRYLATGNEHNAAGHISEDPHNRVRQVDRRLRKLTSIREDLDDREASHQTFYGDPDGEYGLMCWGSTQGVVEEATDRLLESGHSVRALSVSDLMPYPAAEVESFLESVSAALVVEMNATGQFRGLTQRELGRYGDEMSSLLKYDGNPFEPDEVVEGFEVHLDGETDTPTPATRIEPAVSD